VWSARYDGGAGFLDDPAAIGVAGGRVFVTGRSRTVAGENTHYGTVAYDAATGSRLWAQTYAGPSRVWDDATGLAVSPDGTQVWVSGLSSGVPTFDFAYATLAYDAATGVQRWLARYDAPGATDERAWGIVATPLGPVVTGTSANFDTGQIEAATVAYDGSGAVRWTARFPATPPFDHVYAGPIAAAGDRVVVAGTVVFPVTTSADNYSATFTLAYDNN
jgi:hypothetical protein